MYLELLDTEASIAIIKCLLYSLSKFYNIWQNSHCSELKWGEGGLCPSSLQTGGACPDVPPPCSATYAT